MVSNSNDNLSDRGDSRSPESATHDEAILRARDQAAYARERSGWTPMARDALPGYEILQEIHRGGQGVVYLAIQKSAKRKVAVKVMHSSAFQGSKGRARFQREVEILGQLQHSNIVSIHDSGIVGENCYIVMDYISGRALDEYLDQERPSTDACLGVFIAVCQALNAAHLKGVIHRDLKPGNIRVDADGIPHVLDFGLAKLASGESDGGEIMSMTGQFIGSLPWASPEQAQGSPDRIDVRTDVYSLGVILYQMLTGGQFPYEVAGNMRDVLDNILRAEPVRPSTIRRQVGDELETIVLKCLSKDRERRYQNAGELGRDLSRYLNGEPIEAKRDSGWYVFRKTVRRHQPMAISATAFLALLVVFSVAMTISRQSEARAATRAVEASETANKAADDALAAQEVAERQRARAEALVASLVHSSELFFRVDDETTHLRGGFGARETLLRGMVDMLDRVEPFVGDDQADTQVLLLVAETRRRVGELNRSLYGEGERALALIDDAIEMADTVLARNPGDGGALLARGRALASRASIRLSQRELDEAEADSGLAMKVFEAAGDATAPDELALLTADLWMLRARVRARRASGDHDEAEALRFLARARADLAEAEALCESVSGETLADKRSRAMSACRELGHELSLLSGRLYHGWARKAEDDAEAQRLFDAAVRRFEEAVEFNGTAAREFDRLLSQSPRDARLARDRAYALVYEGESLVWLSLAEEKRAERLGEDRPLDQILELRRAAFPLFEEAVEITRGLERINDMDIRTSRDVAICQNKLGNQLRVFGWETEDLEVLRRAEVVFTDSLARREALWRDDPLPQNGHDLAVGLFKRGEVLLMLAERDGDRNRDATLVEACELLERAAVRFAEAGGRGYPVENALRLIGRLRENVPCNNADGD